MNLSGPSLGPMPPVAIWINVLGYLAVFVSWMVILLNQFEVIEDLELAGLITLGLIISTLWVAFLPVLIIYVVILVMVKLFRWLFLKENK